MILEFENGKLGSMLLESNIKQLAATMALADLMIELTYDDGEKGLELKEQYREDVRKRSHQILDDFYLRYGRTDLEDIINDSGIVPQAGK